MVPLSMSLIDLCRTFPSEISVKVVYQGKRLVRLKKLLFHRNGKLHVKFG